MLKDMMNPPTDNPIKKCETKFTSPRYSGYRNKLLAPYFASTESVTIPVMNNQESSNMWLLWMCTKTSWNGKKKIRRLARCFHGSFEAIANYYFKDNAGKEEVGVERTVN